MMRALFHDEEIIRPPERFPHLRKLRGKQFSKEWAHTDVREIIAATSDRRSAGAVIAVLRMIERLLHEPQEWHRAPLANHGADVFDQSWLAGVHRDVKKVKRLNCEKGNHASTLNVITFLTY